MHDKRVHPEGAPQCTHGDPGSSLRGGQLLNPPYLILTLFSLSSTHFLSLHYPTTRKAKKKKKTLQICPSTGSKLGDPTV